VVDADHPARALAQGLAAEEALVAAEVDISAAVALQLDRPDAPGQPGERVRIPLGFQATGSAA